MKRVLQEIRAKSIYLSIYPLSCKGEVMAKRGEEKMDATCKIAWISSVDWLMYLDVISL
jgi:hypothetical protein